KLESLLKLSSETEIVEFKEAKSNYSFDKIGKYFSGLSNEANLKGRDCAWLIFGIIDKNHNIVGTNYRKEKNSLNSLKKEVADKTTNRITFIEIYDLEIEKKRVLMFQIPAAPKGLPIAWEGHYYGRDHESLGPLNLEEIERIRAQAIIEDWSSGIIPDATIDDLDELAIKVARDNFKIKFPNKVPEVDEWDDITFLNKAKITIKNKITRTAILLLGKEEAEHFLLPSVSKIRWLLKDYNGNDKDYLNVSCPFLLSINEIYSKIRNLKYRYIEDGTLFPEEVDQYEPFTIREALNNCIAHQDYLKCGRITIIEKDDQLMFSNLGSFIPTSVEQVVVDDSPPDFYRNRFLVTAMFNLNMVDTAGGGIRKMFNFQKSRFFPMPEYDLSNEKVQLTITGKVLDMEFARILAGSPELTLHEIIMLDKVQKKKVLTNEEASYLKSKKLIEGRKPNYFLSKKIANSIGKKADYSKNRAFDKKYYQDFIIQAIKQHKTLSRKDIDELLWDKLPEYMDEKQKKVKINNLIAELRQKRKIINNGPDVKPKWEISKE
ncbi:MAG: transcriptional regulator, partial [bacterium]|nr:transcriptional regulator [bacterium]